MTDRRHRRLDREVRTIEAMIRIYCEDRHPADRDEAGPAGEPSLCGACRELLDYALCRIDRCPWGADKPACAKCEIHCYKPEPQERIREVMRFAGPRMPTRHPILAVMHVLDGRRPASKDVLRKKRRRTADGS